MEHIAPTNANAQTPKKYFQTNVTYVETRVMENMEMKVPPSPYCATFSTSFLYFNTESTLRLLFKVILGMMVI